MALLNGSAAQCCIAAEELSEHEECSLDAVSLEDIEDVDVVPAWAVVESERDQIGSSTCVDCVRIPFDRLDTGT